MSKPPYALFPAFRQAALIWLRSIWLEDGQSCAAGPCSVRSGRTRDGAMVFALNCPTPVLCSCRPRKCRVVGSPRDAVACSAILSAESARRRAHLPNVPCGRTACSPLQARRWLDEAALQAGTGRDRGRGTVSRCCDIRNTSDPDRPIGLLSCRQQQKAPACNAG